MAESIQANGNTWGKQIGADGSFMRIPTSFRGTISRNAGDTHAAEPNRYHLYVSSACPWAHRTLMVRALKGLTKVISVDVVHPYLTERGWSFETDFPGATGDSVGGLDYLQQVYRATASDYAGVVTVPVLFDKKLQTIVNNESAEIIRMLNAEFNALAERPEIDLYPEHLRHQIDEINSWIYPSINNGVYRSGFAQTQAAHEQAVNELFEGLDRVECLLQTQPMLCGDELTEADVRLFTTLIRFDAVYHTHFKCNRKLIAQYPAMHRYMAKIYRLPGIAETVDMDQIRYHYFYSHRHINPTAIVPRGPDVVAALHEA